MGGGGIHALVVGVGDYPHLDGGSGPAAPSTYRMGQLTSAVPAAKSIEAWLRSARTRLAKPLESCELLESPTLDELSRAALSWRDRCATDRDSIAIFYYAGHGLERSRSDAVLLASDFGDPPGGNPLAKAVDLSDLFHGMAPTRSRPDIARTQLWFVDACLGFPAELGNFQTLAAASVLGVELPLPDRRCAPIHFGALPGTSAYGIPGKGTLFSEALLKCLDGAAAERLPGTGWTVTVDGLGRSLQSVVGRRARGTGQEAWLTGHVVGGKPRPLVTVAGLPTVDVELTLRPATATAGVKVDVTDASGGRVAVPHPLEPNPFADRWPAGVYEFAVAPPLDGAASEQWPVLPPEFAWEV